MSIVDALSLATLKYVQASSLLDLSSENSSDEDTGRDMSSRVREPRGRPRLDGGRHEDAARCERPHERIALRESIWVPTNL